MKNQADHGSLSSAEMEGLELDYRALQRIASAGRSKKVDKPIVKEPDTEEELINRAIMCSDINDLKAVVVEIIRQLGRSGVL